MGSEALPYRTRRDARACERDLEVTATFEDGNTVTRAYRIVPVDDFEEVWLSNNRAWDEALESGTPEYDLKPLYMLEQVR